MTKSVLMRAPIVAPVLKNAYNEAMERIKAPRNPLLLFLGITGIILLSSLVNIFPPDTVYSLAAFFALLIISAYFLGMYTFRRRRHAFLLVLAVTMFFGLRLVGLKHGLYTILLIASILALEYLWKDGMS